MGEQLAHPRAFIKTDILPEATGKEMNSALTIIREGFAEASTPEPHRGSRCPLL